MKDIVCSVAIGIMVLAGGGVPQQELYITRDGPFTHILSIKPKTNHADAFVTVTTFYRMGDKIPWGQSDSIVCYRYLGVDGSHNLHVQREEYRYPGIGNPDPHVQQKEECKVTTLVFGLNVDNAGEITLIGMQDRKPPVLVKVAVKATNNGFEAQYRGDLPLYQEK